MNFYSLKLYGFLFIFYPNVDRFEFDQIKPIHTNLVNFQKKKKKFKTNKFLNLVQTLRRTPSRSGYGYGF